MEEQSILIISGAEVARVFVGDIVLVEQEGRKLHVVTSCQEYRYYEKMSKLEAALDGRFCPCLKGCYVNLERIVSMKEPEIHFDNGYVFCLGRTNFIKLRQKYKLFLKNSVNLA